MEQALKAQSKRRRLEQSQILQVTYALCQSNPKRSVDLRGQPSELGIETGAFWNHVRHLGEMGMLVNGNIGFVHLTAAGITTAEEEIWAGCVGSRKTIEGSIAANRDLLLEVEWLRYQIMSHVLMTPPATSTGYVNLEQFSGAADQERIDAVVGYLEAAGYMEFRGSRGRLTAEGIELAEKRMEMVRGKKKRKVSQAEYVTILEEEWRRKRTALRRPEGNMVWPSKFPTPAGSEWKDVEIRFIDDDTVRVTAKGVSKLFNYAEIDMIDRRRARPDAQWNLLREFADAFGVLTWASRGASSVKKKRKERLSMTLRELFGLAGEPIPWVARAWRTQFRIHSATNAPPPTRRIQISSES